MNSLDELKRDANCGDLSNETEADFLLPCMQHAWRQKENLYVYTHVNTTIEAAK